MALSLTACAGNVDVRVDNVAVGGRNGAGGTGSAGTPASIDAGPGGAPGGLGGAPGAGGAGAASVDAADERTGASGRIDAGADAPRDGASDLGGLVPALCPPTALVCDDFEDGNLTGWTALPAGGTITVDTTHARSGRSALSINIPANQRGGFIERTGSPLFPLPAGQLFGRIMVYFDSVPDGHSDIVRGAPVGGNIPWYNVGGQHGEILLNYYNGAASDCWARPSPGRPVPIATWTCWEWSFDSTRNQMQFWIDGALSRQVNAVGDGCLTNPGQTWLAPQFGSIRIGEYIAEISAIPTRIWIDDVAIGNQGRLGCPPAP